MIKLALRSEYVLKVQAFLLREGDDFTYGRNSERGMFYDWTPKDFEESRPWTGVVATAKMRGGGTTWAYLTRTQVIDRRPSYWASTPWKTNEDEMVKKTAVRALAKYLPKSTDLGRVLEADEAKVLHLKGVDEVKVTRLDDEPDTFVVQKQDPMSRTPRSRPGTRRPSDEHQRDPHACTCRRVSWHRIRVTAGCWLWTGPVWKGYGHSGGMTAHRHVWLDLGRTIPAGLELDHLRRKPLCVNPDHLDPVTRAENARRRALALVTCVSGHDYTPENTYIRPDGARDCRVCIRARVAKYRQTRKIGAAARCRSSYSVSSRYPVTPIRPCSSPRTISLTEFVRFSTAIASVRSRSDAESSEKTESASSWALATWP